MKKRSLSWFLPKILTRRQDGGPQSNTFGYWLIEWKPVCSLGLLKFAPDARENFHSHAFNAWGWLLSGTLIDVRPNPAASRCLRPGGYGVIKRSTIHKVRCMTYSAWMLTVRGPWAATWLEVEPDGSVITLGEHRTVQS